MSRSRSSIPPGSEYAVRVGIVADDLTGAADSLVQFRSQGWESHLRMGQGPLKAHAVPLGARAAASSAVACSLDSRSMPDAMAAQVTGQEISRLIDKGLDYIYVKIDSTLRGSIRGQIRGALGAWAKKAPAAFAIICPAYPRTGRIIVGGEMRVNGIPLKLSPAGQDPVDPVQSSELAALIPEARLVRVAPTARDFTAELRRLAAPGASLVVEAQQEADLRAIAQAIGSFGADAVPVGSAGLAGHLARVWRAPGQEAGSLRHIEPVLGRLLVVVTSLNKVSLGQADRLAQEGPALVERHFLDPGGTRDSALPSVSPPQGVYRDGGGEPLVLLLQPRSGDQSGDGSSLAAAVVARRLALSVKDRVSRGMDVSGFILVGGDGARAVLAELGAEAIQLQGTLAEGIPWGYVVGGAAAGKIVVTKAGGFGEVDALSRIVSTMIGMDGKYQ